MIQWLLTFKVSFENSTGGERGSGTLIMNPNKHGTSQASLRTGASIGAFTKYWCINTY